MGNIGWPQILIIVVLIVLFFGRGKISEVMGDVAKGIKNFRQGLSEEEAAADQPAEPQKIQHSEQVDPSVQQTSADAQQEK